VSDFVAIADQGLSNRQRPRHVHSSLLVRAVLRLRP
jgi:hypothetical protein